MKVLLCNDTGTKSHIGCLGVSDGHARMLGRAGHRVEHRYFVGELARFARSTWTETMSALARDSELAERIESVDAVVVNGEGTIHHNKGIEYLALLDLAKKKGKASLLVNALFQEIDIDPEVINRFDAFSVRDKRSLAYARSRGIRCSYSPDSILEAKFDSRLSVDFCDNLVVTDWVQIRDADVGVASLRLLASAPLLSPYRFFPIHGSEVRNTWRSAVQNLRTARMIVTGRHHAMYLSILAKVPFVPLASNSWKIQGLLDSAGLNQSIVSSFAELKTEIEKLASSPPNLAEAHDRLVSERPLSTFSVLGKGGEKTSEEEEVCRLESQILNRPSALARDRRLIAKRRVRESRAFLKLVDEEGNDGGLRGNKLLSKLRKVFRK
ncbi:polysaccharide pyruvyl transferase family protein [Taklimakanibacter lacteus]|uniref:polysaccharide pyruvyl transferase family protein n=1 Tax=Taklimakanibacter lacteus TaxID=2268456 RepID=UPI0013C413AD